MSPDILIAVANDATFWQDQLAQLQEDGVAVVYASQPNAEEFGLNDSLGGYNVSLVNGKVLADAAVAFTCGTGTEFVFYNIPEFRSEEHTSELQSLMRTSYAVFCLKKKKHKHNNTYHINTYTNHSHCK